MRSASRAVALILASTSLALSGCGGSEPVAGPTPSSGGPRHTAEPRMQLAARAAAAKDLRQVARYTLRSSGRPDRTVTVTRAMDGGWRVDVPASALGGTVDVAIVRTGGRLYQCALATTAYPVPRCVVISRVSRGFDPRVHHVFTDWLDVFTDRAVALVVSTSNGVTGAAGTCYSVDTSTVSVAAPVDAGIYCYAEDGTLTAARTPFGTLVLAVPPAPGPDTVTLPAPIVTGKPLPNASPDPVASTQVYSSTPAH